MRAALVCIGVSLALVLVLCVTPPAVRGPALVPFLVLALGFDIAGLALAVVGHPPRRE